MTGKVEVIKNRERAELFILSKVENARFEILASFGSFSNLSHLFDIGLVDKLKRAKSNGVHVMIICPSIPDDYKTNRSNDKNEEMDSLIANLKSIAEVQFRSATIMGNLLVIDNNEILILAGDAKETESFAIISDSRSLITNYTSLFESFWIEKETLQTIVDARMELVNQNALLLASNDQLKKNEQFLKDFINMAAHELRTPLQPIIGVMGLYDISAKEGEVIQVKTQDMRLVARNAALLEHLCSDILDACRIDNNTLVMDKAKIDFVRLVSEIIEDARKQVSGRSEFILVKREAAMFVDGDWNRLRLVLGNLLDNAIKLSSGGMISVTVERIQNDKVRTAIASTGTGISPEMMSTIFQKFGIKTAAGTSTGLGMFISKAIVEAHGGDLWVDNNADGMGVTFYVTLPLIHQKGAEKRCATSCTG
jgi:signal transduction histidine kinase